MGRLAWSQLRFRPAQAVALLLGMLLATTAFTVLTAASRTSQLRTAGTISAHFVPAYDILVRPRGARTRLEAQTGTVQPDFLSGSYGGISLAQYRLIRQLPGVQVAAPVAMVGYVLLHIFLPEPLPAADYARPGRQLYRYTTTWVSAGGTTRIGQPPAYLYLTPDRLVTDPQGGTDEVLAGGARTSVCPPSGTAANPFGQAAQSAPWCWSKVDGTAGSFTGGAPRRAFATVNWSFPMLIAAVDPAAEARLDGLNRALTSGRYLAENLPAVAAGTASRVIPVLAAASSGIGEYAVTTVRRLSPPAAPPSLGSAGLARLGAASGPVAATVTISAQQAYRQLLGRLRLGGRAGGAYVHQSWTIGPVRYRPAAGGVLTPVQVRNPTSVWQPTEEVSQLLEPPMDETDSQYRPLRAYPSAAAAAAASASAAGGSAAGGSAVLQRPACSTRPGSGRSTRCPRSRSVRISRSRCARTTRPAAARWAGRTCCRA